MGEGEVGRRDIALTPAIGHLQSREPPSTPLEDPGVAPIESSAVSLLVSTSTGDLGRGERSAPGGAIEDSEEPRSPSEEPRSNRAPVQVPVESEHGKGTKVSGQGRGFDVDHDHKKGIFIGKCSRPGCQYEDNPMTDYDVMKDHDRCHKRLDAGGEGVFHCPKCHFLTQKLQVKVILDHYDVCLSGSKVLPHLECESRECNLKFYCEGLKTLHMKKAHGGGKIVCDGCGHMERSEAGLKDHKKGCEAFKQLRIDKSDVVCHQCGETYVQKRHLTLHLKACDKQRKSEPTSCLACGTVFSERRHFRTHQRICEAHNKTINKTHRCVTCLRWFTLKKYRNVHSKKCLG